VFRPKKSTVPVRRTCCCRNWGAREKANANSWAEQIAWIGTSSQRQIRVQKQQKKGIHKGGKNITPVDTLRKKQERDQTAVEKKKHHSVGGGGVKAPQKAV